MTTTPPRNRRRLAGALVACTLLFAACSSEGSETATSELPTLTDPSAEETTESSTDDGGDTAAAETAETAETSGASTSSGANEPLSDADQDKAFAEYERCMSDFGIDMNFGTESDGSSFETTDDGASGSEADGDVMVQSFDGEFDDENFQAAEEECGPILEEAFGSFEMSPEEEAEMADAMLEMERCLGEKGYDIDLDGGAFQVDADDDFEAFDAAMNECSEAAFGDIAGEAGGVAEAAG